MKYLKMLGLTIVAALAVMAFAGAGTASATVLCKTNTTPCTSKYEVGQEMAAEAESTLVLRAGFGNVECEKSTVSGTLSEAGSATATPVLPLAAGSGLTFSNCNGTVTVTGPGKVIFHYNAGTMNTTLTSEGAKVDVTLAGVTCTYGTTAATTIGTLTGTNVTGGTPTMDVSAELNKEAGGFLCANPAHWEGSYKVTNPMEGYGAES